MADIDSFKSVMNKINDKVYKPFVDKVFRFKDVRNASYNYHLNGLDVFYNRPDDSRKVILENINNINSINSKNFNSTIITLFINAKSDEITNIFKVA